MNKLKIIDYLTSFVAATCWLLGGFVFFVVTGRIFRLIFLGKIQNNQMSPIFIPIGLIVIVAFVIGAWASIKYVLKYFMNKTKQAKVDRTIRMFKMLSWLSIFILLPAEWINRDSIFLSYLFWFLALEVIYLYSRTRALN